MRISASDYRDWIRLATKIVVLVAILWVIFGICFGLYRMDGVAMSDRIKDGDLVLISRLSDAFSYDDAIVFERNGKTFVSRIVAFPGDVVKIDQQGCLCVNDVRVSDDIVYNAEQDEPLKIRLPYYVPNNSYFVLNENLDALEDSREFGAIPLKNIQGKAISTLRTREI